MNGLWFGFFFYYKSTRDPNVSKSVSFVLLYGAFFIQPSFLDVPNTILLMKNLTDFVWLVPIPVYKVVKMGPTHIFPCKMGFYWQE